MTAQSFKLDLSVLEARLKLYIMRLEARCISLNFKLQELTIDGLLDFAIEAEKTANDVGLMDPAWSHFKRQQSLYQDMAELLETKLDYERQIAALKAPDAKPHC